MKPFLLYLTLADNDQKILVNMNNVTYAVDSTDHPGTTYVHFVGGQGITVKNSIQQIAKPINLPS